MKVIYDPDKDILQIAFVATVIEETTQIAPGLVLDYDEDGQVIGLEIRKASSKFLTTSRMLTSTSRFPALRSRSRHLFSQFVSTQDERSQSAFQCWGGFHFTRSHGLAIYEAKLASPAFGGEGCLAIRLEEVWG